MNYGTVALIFAKEIRDQLRDRRTIFVMILAPMLLYPTLAFVFVRLAPTLVKVGRPKIGVIGRQPQSLPPLFTAESAAFHPSLYTDAPFAAAFELVTKTPLSRNDIRSGTILALVEFRDVQSDIPNTPTVTIHFDGSSELSRAAYGAVREIVEAWRRSCARAAITGLGQPLSLIEPFTIAESTIGDVSTSQDRSQSMWSRLLPFALVMLLLTGAFYPAIDLCAGEKERGTMETLLISPALRTEIVIGKFLTIWVFSLGTTLLNLISLSFSVMYAAERLPMVGGNIHPPSIAALFAIVTVIVPLSAFLSAWCMALAVFARSTREGQYYLTPLFLIATPLIFLSVAPGVSLTFVTALVPIANVALLIKALLAGGDSSTALSFVPLVIGPTVLYAVLALVWAIDQFQREDVLFREAERIDPRAWIRWLLRAKEATPDTGESFFVFILIVGLCSYAWSGSRLALGASAIGYIGLVLAPTLIWAFVLTSEPSRTFLLKRPRYRELAFGLGLALMSHPALAAVATLCRQHLSSAGEFLGLLVPNVEATSLWSAILVLGILRAVAEEFVFRGFMLQGLRRRYPSAIAVGVAALLAGIFPLVTWYAPVGALTGGVLGMLAIRTGSIFPGLAFSVVANSLMVPYLYPNVTHTAVSAWDFPLAELSAIASLGALMLFLRRDDESIEDRSN